MQAKNKQISKPVKVYDAPGGKEIGWSRPGKRSTLILAVYDELEVDGETWWLLSRPEFKEQKWCKAV